MDKSSAVLKCKLLWFAALVVGGGAVGTALAFGTTGQARALGLAWYVTAGFTYVALIPLSGWAHWHFFRRAWRNGAIRPEGYFKAFAALAAGLTAAVLLMCGMSLLRRALIPDLLLALPPLLMLMGSWPSGWALGEHVESAAEVDTVEEEDLLNIHSKT